RDLDLAVAVDGRRPRVVGEIGSGLLGDLREHRKLVATVLDTYVRLDALGCADAFLARAEILGRDHLLTGRVLVDLDARLHARTLERLLGRRSVRSEEPLVRVRVLPGLRLVLRLTSDFGDVGDQLHVGNGRLDLLDE